MINAIKHCAYELNGKEEERTIFYPFLPFLCAVTEFFPSESERGSLELATVFLFIFLHYYPSTYSPTTRPLFLFTNAGLE